MRRPVSPLRECGWPLRRATSSGARQSARRGRG